MIITLSDRASQGEYEDRSGPAIAEKLQSFLGMNNWQYEIDHKLIPDDPEQLDVLIKDAVNQEFDLIFTTGGTGIGPRDFTPDVVKKHLDIEIPGLMDHIRLKYGSENPQALISRSIAGRINECLVFVLPGSVKAISEYMHEILAGLRHMLFMTKGIDIH
jgi:molybdenum cofactor synthesis domain-containing protein